MPRRSTLSPVRTAQLPQAVCMALHRQTGFGLTELILVAAATVVVAAAVYSLYDAADTARAVAAEKAHVTAIAEAVIRANVARADFVDVSPSQVIADGLYPSAMIDPNLGQPTSVWGLPVSVASTPSGGALHGGFAITYTGVPRRACAALAVQGGGGFYDVRVAGSSVMFPSVSDDGLAGKPGGRLDPDAAVRACAQSPASDVVFVYARSHQGTVASCVAPPAEQEQRPKSCPSGQRLPFAPYDTDWMQRRTRSYACNPSGTVDPEPWSSWGPAHACAPACVDEGGTDTQAFRCARPGDLITTPGPHQYSPGPVPQTSAWTRTCGTPVGPLGPKVSAPWTPSYACAPACAAPAPTTTVVTRACPLGLIDSQPPHSPSGITDTTVRTFACPAPVGAFTWSDATTTENRCAPACVVPAPAVELRCTSAVQSQACPSGTSGSPSMWQWEETRTASCLAPTGAATWSSWTATGSRCNVVSNACTPNPPACSWPAPPSQSQMCPNGVDQQFRSCAHGTCPAWSCTAWSACPATPPACVWPAAPTASPPCPGGGSQAGGSWQHGANCPAWVYSGGSCPPPVCAWPPVPSTTPVCPGGGNQSGGAWQRGAACPSWVYVGGACPAPPAPAVFSDPTTCRGGVCRAGYGPNTGNTFSPLRFEITIAYNGDMQRASVTNTNACTPISTDAGTLDKRCPIDATTATVSVGGKTFTLHSWGSGIKTFDPTIATFWAYTAWGRVSSSVGSAP